MLGKRSLPPTTPHPHWPERVFKTLSVWAFYAHGI